MWRHVSIDYREEQSVLGEQDDPLVYCVLALYAYYHFERFYC